MNKSPVQIITNNNSIYLTHLKWMKTDKKLNWTHINWKGKQCFKRITHSYSPADDAKKGNDDKSHHEFTEHGIP